MAIDLWAAHMERPLTEQEETTLMLLLPSGRKERLLQVQQHDKWREPLCAYAVLRQALWEQCHWREFPQVALTSFGKPYFPEYPEVHFNISHTHGAILVGVSDDPLGVDIEKVRPVSERSMRRLADVTTAKEFFRNWVRLEARAKRGGNGVGTMIQSDSPLQFGESYYNFDMFEGYVAGVATRSPSAPGKIHKYTLDSMME